MPGMSAFDKLCGFTEYLIEQTRIDRDRAPESVLRLADRLRIATGQANIFDIPTPDGGDDLSGVDESVRRDVLNDFFLPLPSVYLDNGTGGGVLLSAPEGRPQSAVGEGQLTNDTQFVSIAPVASSKLTAQSLSGKYNVPPEYLFLFMIGFWSVIPPEAGDTRVSVYGKIGLQIMWNARDRHMVDLLGPENSYDKQETILASDMLSLAATRIALANLPSRFVMEVSPAKPVKQGPKLLRQHERSRFVLLTPTEIRKRYIRAGDPAYTGRHVGAHSRRAHWRTLSSDRYVNAKGTRLHIPATWVGPSEAVVGNKRYKVRLDL